MSETAPEPSGGGGGIGGTLGRKMGPMPVWLWLVILTVAALGFYLWKQHTAAASSGTAVTGTGSVTPASSVPDYVSQTTINLTEPPETTTPPPGPPPKKKPPGGGGGGAPKGPPPKRTPRGKTPQPPLLSSTYTVKPGDTLDKLAAKFGISRVDLAHGNGLGTGAGLRTGQVLKVPGPLKTRAEGGPG